MTNYWKETIEFINKKDDYKGVNYYNSFSPKDIKNEIYGYSFYSTGTVNSYFRTLVILGYIYRIDQGKYIKVRDIPTNLSYSVAKKFAYSIEPKLIDRYLKILMIKENMKHNINI